MSDVDLAICSTISRSMRRPRNPDLRRSRDARASSCRQRRAARVKPVIVVKGGRQRRVRGPPLTHRRAAGADIVYEAAFRRAACFALTSSRSCSRRRRDVGADVAATWYRLAIVTNGGGAGVMATDRSSRRAANRDPQRDSVAKLNAVLPPTWSHSNPVDLIGDADAARYTNAVEILMQDANIDALLVAYCPTAIGTSADAAKGLIDVLSKPGTAPKKNVFACWMGEANVADGRAQLVTANLPDYETPERAVRAFMYLVRYQQSQDLLLQTPSSVVPSPQADSHRARDLIRRALDDRREWLDPSEIAEFSLATVFRSRAPTLADAKRRPPRQRGSSAPVALKIRSRDIVHKSDVVAWCSISPARRMWKRPRAK
jgi:acetyltransferase